MMYWGIISTCPGSSMVMIMQVNHSFRPLKLMRARA